MAVFNRYAFYYDLLYKEKNYSEECDFIRDAVKEYSPIPVTTLLDVGCGTGNHAIELSKRNYRVTGVDASEQMLVSAREKTKNIVNPISFHCADMRTFRLSEKFDAILCMFAALSYISTNQDLETAFLNFRSHLKSKGLFIFDCWNGLATIRILPSERTKIITDKEWKLIRYVVPELDAVHHLCHNHYQLYIIKDNTLSEEIVETHTMRYFFPQELAYFLEKTGFDVLKICEFPKLDMPIDETIWNMAVIARAKD